MKDINLNGKSVGKDEPCLIMVDAGVNHNNDPKLAFELIRTAARAGADVIKFQTYTADSITTKKAPRYWDSALDTDSGGTQYDTFNRLDNLPAETYYDMVELCNKEKILFSSTPFDLDSAKFLEDIGIDFFKISSSDLTYHRLIQHVADTGKPVILSTGTASLSEISEAVEIILSSGNDKILLQHCILSYPCNDEDANLAKMLKIMEKFPDIPVGYSDHTKGIYVPLAAVALGARSIEKHYTLNKSLPDSPDHSLSLDPLELEEMVKGIRTVENSIGCFTDGHYPCEEKAFKYARKSIVSIKDIPYGTIIDESMISCKRPGTGIYPKYFNEICGKIAKEDIEKDTTITWDMIEK